MSISETDKIDLANIDSATDDLILTVTDRLDWSGKEEHLCLLQDKLSAYLRFVESGEVYKQIPLAVGRMILFRVMGKFQPSEAADRFYELAGRFIEDAGFSLPSCD
jgi:hypothetical protein